MTKLCGKCKEDLPLESFRWKDKQKTKLQSYCIECNKQVNREHFQKNKEKYAEKRIAYREEHSLRMRTKRYGITVEEFETFQVESKGLCALCNSRVATEIDHNHETGKVRGLLCKQCNMGLGYFADNVDVLARAIEYLKK